MRLDLGKRASSIIDARTAAAHDHKHVQEIFDDLMRLAL